MNRQELQQNFISCMIDDMDLQTLTNIVSDYLEEDLDKLDDEELLQEVTEFYPNLIAG